MGSKDVDRIANSVDPYQSAPDLGLHCLPRPVHPKTGSLWYLQAEQLSYTQLLDYLVVLVMAAIWFVMPSDGIAVISQWFYNKVMDVSIVSVPKCISPVSYIKIQQNNNPNRIDLP